jgi:predicted  nucleic acid-binding Zn-ribbon protein
MGPVLSSLVELQSVETRLRQAEQKLKRTRRAVTRQELQIARLKEALAARHEDIRLTRLHYDRIELDLRSREAEIAKLRVALNTARTNKDYSAILTRINTDKADSSKLEDQCLQLMSQIEADQAQSKLLQAEIAQEEQKLAGIRTETDSKSAQLEVEVNQLRHEHEQAASHVPPKERSMFRRLAERYDGEVLAVIEEQNRRGDYICSGCYIKVTLECVNALMTRDEMFNCPNCGRILVLDSAPIKLPTSR